MEFTFKHRHVVITSFNSAPREIFPAFLSSADFFKINFFEKFFQENNQSAKQFGSMSGPTERQA